MSVYQSILFDLDGTLTDPRQGITRSVQYALEKVGIIEENLDKLTPFIGPALIDSFQEYYGFSEEQARVAVGYYRERFSSQGLFENDPLPGIPELLQQLVERGVRLFVATSKPEVYASQIIANFQLDHYFEFVSGSLLDGTRADKTEVIAYIFENYPELEREHTLMVGDRKFDIHGAHAQHIDVVGVDYGYAQPGELELAQPTYQVATVEELATLILAHTPISNTEKV